MFLYSAMMTVGMLHGCNSVFNQMFICIYRTSLAHEALTHSWAPGSRLL